MTSGLDYRALKRQEKVLREREKATIKERHERWKEKGYLSASTFNHPCWYFPYLELTKGMKGLPEKDIQTLSRLQGGHEFEPVEEARLLSYYGGDIEIIRRNVGKHGTYLESDKHKICGSPDRWLRYKKTEPLVGEFKGTLALVATLHAMQEREEDIFNFLRDPGAGMSKLQMWAGQAVIYPYLYHLKNPKVHRCLLVITSRDTFWQWPIWIDINEDEYAEYLDSLLKKIQFLHQAAAGEKTVRRTKDWSLCNVCERHAQCVPEMIAGLDKFIDDEEVRLLAEAEIRAKQSHLEWKRAHDRLHAKLKERFEENTPTNFADKFKDIRKIEGSDMAIQVSWHWREGFEVGGTWVFKHQPISSKKE